MLNKIDNLYELMQEHVYQLEVNIPVDAASIKLAKHILKIEKNLKQVNPGYSLNVMPVNFEPPKDYDPIALLNTFAENAMSGSFEIKKETIPALVISLSYNNKELGHWTTGIHLVKYQGLDYQEYESTLAHYLKPDYQLEEQIVFSEDPKLYTSILEHLIIEKVLTNEKQLKATYSFANQLRNDMDKSYQYR